MQNKIEEYLELVMNSDFPYNNYSDSILKADYKKLKENISPKSNTGLKLIQQFHPSIWRCNRDGYKAPIDAWNDPDIMYKVIENRLKYLKTDDLSIFNIRAGLTIAKKAPKVSIFRPALAKYLIKKYLNEYNTIFDPCCGFSGRMLGTCCLNKQYIGQDINSITINESKQLNNFLNLNAQLYKKDSIYDSGIYECLFTCPPYGNKEIWHQDIEIFSAEEWINICLNNYKCRAYLFIVDNPGKYAQHVIETIKNTSHFGTNQEYIILIC